MLNNLIVLTAIGFGLISGACNKKDDEPTVDDYVASESVAVTAFYLSPDIRVMKNLDSVFFSIDLEHGVIFNADSLPKGTPVNKLIPKITYPSSVNSAVITMTGGSHREGTVNYFTNPGDTIDFTGDVTLTLATKDRSIEKTYKLKVNVHKEDPDTFYWSSTASMELPSRLPNPKEQKTVRQGDQLYSMIAENDGSFTVSTTSDVFSGTWQKEWIKDLEKEWIPRVSTFTVGPDGTMYVLTGDALELYGPNDTAWSQAGEGWTNIIGWYGNVLLGVSETNGGIYLKSYPENAFSEMKLPDGFPTQGFSAPVTFNNRWGADPTIVIFGGNTAGSSSPSWAFDGNEWVDISETPLPYLEGLAVVDYYSFLKSSSNGLLKEFGCYLAYGGKDRDGNLNNTVYITYDNGINWQPAQKYMQLPAGLQIGYMADAFSIGSSRQSNLSNRWKVAPQGRKIPFNIDGDIIQWDCPYIFVFGGYNPSMHLIPQIRSGVLQRLTFVPLF